MNLIQSLNLLSTLSPDNIASRPRVLQLVNGNQTLPTEVVNRGLVECDFNFTSDETNTEVFTYEPGDLCSFGITTVAYFTSPVFTNISKEDESNTFTLEASYHFAAMETDNEDGNVYCYENGIIKTSSTQYRDGTASFVVRSGEITIGPQNIGNWTTIAVNGGDRVNIPGFYYVKEGFAEGGVMFLDDKKTMTEPNYTNIDATLIDLCYATVPTPAPTYAPTPAPNTASTPTAAAAEVMNGAVAKNVLLVIGAILPVSVFFLI